MLGSSLAHLTPEAVRLAALAEAMAHPVPALIQFATGGETS